MANKLPLVLYNGEFAQLQSGDTLQVPQIGVDVIDQTNGESTPIVFGTPVYSSGNDTVKKAKADAAGTADVIGIVYDSSITNGVSGQIACAPGGVVTGTTTQWDAVAGTSGGLTFNTKYWLSQTTAGMLTSTAPSTVGQFNTLVGIAISTTELKLILRPKITL